MRIIFKVLSVSLVFLISCQAQKGKSFFGEYYPIEDYGIQVPFAGQPNIISPKDAGLSTLMGYQFEYANRIDDINWAYGIDICKFKNDNLVDSLNYQEYLKNAGENAEIKYFAGISEVGYKIGFEGKLIEEKFEEYRNQPCIRQKIHIVVNEDKIVINLLYFKYKNSVFKLYVFTPLKQDDNIRINDFFESVKFDSKV